MEQLKNITITLEDHRLMVNCDMEILMEDNPAIHEDDKGWHPKLENRTITNINFIQYILLDKHGLDIDKTQWGKCEPTIKQLVLNEVEDTPLETLKVM